ncbi:uncharacterized protein LOC111297821 [Durio zibethinus]|uniref:Uncharacterized protein LOC111297821 n=1 Tax=Durio zibethinus TaxID=66656 RepID=A0A6P5Z6G2_DURZI|nr:uncharacterized protein LOC111297821 [Durio zibethinus]
MEKYFGNAYRGDPGVPHSGPDRFVNIWIGSVAFSVITWFNPYIWQLANQFKYLCKPLQLCVLLLILCIGACFCPDFSFFLIVWNMSNDKAMIFEHYHWKKAKAKKQRYKIKWNEYMDKDHRDSYYFNWPVYFP